MGPENSLPHSPFFTDAEQYVDSLLDFVGRNQLLRTLCGGIHILDFFTSDPDLYSQVLPEDWRNFFAQHDIMDILDLLMREDLDLFKSRAETDAEQRKWRHGPLPPLGLLEYVRGVRRHLLLREPAGSQCSRNRALKQTQRLARHVAVGMSIKKVHEVGLFAHYLNNLTESITVPAETGEEQRISHLVDFGSGQNYLGRALASEPYNRRIVAIESKSHNAERAREFDVMARLTEKKKIMRNKKLFRAATEDGESLASLPAPPPEETEIDGSAPSDAPVVLEEGSVELPAKGKGKIRYIEHRIQDGDLQEVVARMHDNPASMNLMVMSLHSCGNLVHHGLRSLILNPQVKAVAMVGCCYNLLTERLGPATYKLPSLRPTAHIRLEKEATACDPHGFPMSHRLCRQQQPQGDDGEGIKFNITARMMAVQAPQNWGENDSESFFKRHFFRALLQRIFLDRGVVGPPSKECLGGSPAGHSSGTPIIIGSLRKSCYDSFTAYVRGALVKLESEESEHGALFREKMAGLTDREIEGYETAFADKKKNLSAVWSLMAFSAGVIEAAIVVDRWLWLKEHAEVNEAWVEPVFDYAFSPRNLVVVGVKK